MQFRRLSRVFGVSLGLLFLVAVVLFAPPPRPLLRGLVSYSYPFLMEGDSAGASRVARLSKKLLRVYVNVALARTLADRVLEEGGSDEEILGRMLAEVRAIVLTPAAPRDVRFATESWPALLSGVGYCDQVNAIVCRMAAHHFPKAELVALMAADGASSPHAIGRVWSEHRGQWLYFDAFFATPVIFTREGDGPRFLSVDGGVSMPSRGVAPPEIYALAERTLSDFPGTFGMYLIRRATSGSLDPEESAAIPSEVVADAKQGDAKQGDPLPERSRRRAGNPRVAKAPPVVFRAPVPARPVLSRPEVFDSVLRKYGEARIAHLFDHPDRGAYQAVTLQARAAQKDDRAAEIVNAARRFAALTK